MSYPLDGPTAGSQLPRAPGPFAERTRVEAFSDGVFAIAITLLVLNLKAPASRGQFVHDLLAQWPAYAAYLASFGYIGVIWSTTTICSAGSAPGRLRYHAVCGVGAGRGLVSRRRDDTASVRSPLHLVLGGAYGGLPGR